MIILDYQRKFHKKIVHAAALALTQGKVVAYPTDTSYGLACDINNKRALDKLYKIKERDFNKPVHIVVPSLDYAKKIAAWTPAAIKLAKKFWPGPLTLVLPLKKNTGVFYRLGAKTGTIGLRFPQNDFSLDFTRHLKAPITATGANPSARLSKGYDSYSAEDIVKQFKKKKFKPEIIINAGHLPKRKPSTIVKINGRHMEILRNGPISSKQISQVLKHK